MSELKALSLIRTAVTGPGLAHLANLDELLVRRSLLVEAISNRIQTHGEEGFLFDASAP